MKEPDRSFWNARVYYYRTQTKSVLPRKGSVWTFIVYRGGGMTNFHRVHRRLLKRSVYPEVSVSSSLRLIRTGSRLLGGLIEEWGLGEYKGGHII